MELQKFDITNKKETVFIENLYIESFPLSERRPIEKMLDFYENKKYFDIYIVVEDGEYIGFLTYWYLTDHIFIEHFAIAPEYRNGGYGRKVMELFINNINRPIILEVELPNTILSERRIGFYQRIGFKLWNKIAYQQPPYHKENSPIPMKLMSYGDVDLDNRLSEIRDEIYETVYNY